MRHNASDKQLSFLVFVHGFKELSLRIVSLGIVCMGTFIRNTSLASLRVGSFAWEISFGILRFETSVWKLSVDNLRLGPATFCCVESLAWELRSTLCVLDSLGGPRSASLRLSRQRNTILNVECAWGSEPKCGRRWEVPRVLWAPVGGTPCVLWAPLGGTPCVLCASSCASVLPLVNDMWTLKY